jgi:small conductance mechanosensitive channel
MLNLLLAADPNGVWQTIDNWFIQHGIWARLLNWAAETLPLVLYALLILIIGRWVAKTISSLVEKGLHKTHVDPTLGSFAKHLIYAAIMVFVVIAALSKVGIETSSFAVVVGAAGLAVGLALQGSLSNFAAGVMLILFKPFKVGDFVEIAGTKGVVTELEIFNTIINTPDNIKTIIPNSHVTGANITNYTANGTRRIDLVFGISYDDDIRKARLVMMDELTKDKRILGEPAPSIVVSELAESSVNMTIMAWTKTADYGDARFALIENIKVALEQNGITMPFPQRDLYIKNGPSLLPAGKA